ncbi:MAG TPA: hypothetical protein PLX17_10695, partial [Chitinophagaceae bacterium]|nr:hypothetical protein [Chitinophagaceae bacterium]
IRHSIYFYTSNVENKSIHQLPIAETVSNTDCASVIPFESGNGCFIGIISEMIGLFDIQK